MSKKAFSLIQLIVVIVIIGILVAVAVPKFLNFKKHAIINNTFKIYSNIISSIPHTFTSRVDLENHDIDWDISHYYHIKEKGWAYEKGDYHGKKIKNAISYRHEGKYIIWIGLGVGDKRSLNIWITCNEYEDKQLRKFCHEKTKHYKEDEVFKNGKNIKFKHAEVTF